MPGNKKPKKRYRPMDPEALLVCNAINVINRKAKPIDTARQFAIATDAWTAIDRLKRGVMDKRDWNILADVNNHALMLAKECKVGFEYVPDLHEAKTSLISIGDRYARVGKFGGTGPEIQTLVKMIEIHEAQFEVATTGDMEVAATKVMHYRISGNKYVPGKGDPNAKADRAVHRQSAESGGLADPPSPLESIP